MTENNAITAATQPEVQPDHLSVATIPPTILSYLKDIPNLCSLAGLACTVMAIYSAILGNFDAAMIGMVWAVGFDWADGLIARRLKNRTGNDRQFGGQLDVLIDIVSYGVTPAILLLSYGEYHLTYLIAAFIVLSAAALRLSFFSTYGLCDGASYTGLALDNNSLLIVFIFLFESVIGSERFSVVLLVTCLSLAGLNVSQVKTPKLSGNPVNVYILAAYTLGITSYFGMALL